MSSTPPSVDAKSVREKCSQPTGWDDETQSFVDLPSWLIRDTGTGRVYGSCPDGEVRWYDYATNAKPSAWVPFAGDAVNALRIGGYFNERSAVRGRGSSRGTAPIPQLLTRGTRSSHQPQYTMHPPPTGHTTVTVASDQSLPERKRSLLRRAGTQIRHPRSSSRHREQNTASDTAQIPNIPRAQQPSLDTNINGSFWIAPSSAQTIGKLALAAVVGCLVPEKYSALGSLAVLGTSIGTTLGNWDDALPEIPDALSDEYGDSLWGRIQYTAQNTSCTKGVCDMAPLAAGVAATVASAAMGSLPWHPLSLAASTLATAAVSAYQA